jgi:NACalpha-BTF3-like transcription factor
MSLAVLADHMASKGRGPDSMLIHMSPREVQGLQALAIKHGGSLTINPDTGLPEAGFLDKLLPSIIGAGISFFSGGTIDPMTAAAIVGGVETARTGDIGKGISAGLGAYGGANLTTGLTEAGASTIGAAEAARGLTMTPELLAEFGGDSAKDALLQQQVTERMAAATPYEKLSSGFDAFKNNPTGMAKSLAMPAAMAFGPAILAGANVKNNMPQTVTKPGMITPYSYFNGQYVAGTPYQAAPTRAASGGIMGFDESSNSPMSRQSLSNMQDSGGMFNYAHDGGGVMKMAQGGIAGYADGGSAAAAYAAANNIDLNKNINQWITDNPNANRATIDAEMNKYGISQDDVNRALSASTATSAAVDYGLSHGMGLSDINQNIANFTNVTNKNATDAQIDAAMSQYGISNEDVARALKATGGSQGEQYALLAGNMGLSGLNTNINSWLAANPKATLADAQAAMSSVNINEADVLRATGKSLADLYPKKLVCGDGFELNAAGTACVKKTLTCGPGYEPNAAGTECVRKTTTDTKTIVCGVGFHPSIDGKSCVKDLEIVDDFHFCPTGQHWDASAGKCVANISATQETTTTVDTPTSLTTAVDTALPVGVSGTTGPSIIGGGSTVNPNGTITTSPVIPGIPVGGFTGMEDVRNAYTKGGGSLGYIPYAPKTIEEFDKKYTSRLTGGSKQAYDYLTGKTKYTPVPFTEDGQIAKPYAESVMKMPVAASSKMYIFKNGRYEVNPDYAIPTYDKDGKKTYNVTNADVKTFMDKNPSTDAFYTWATTNNLSPEQVALASGRPINEVSKLFTGAKDLVGEDGKIDQTKLDEKTAADEKANFDYVAYLKANPDVQAELDAGKANFGSKDDLAAAAYEHYQRYGKAQKRALKAEGGLAALTMARGGISNPFFSKTTGKFTSRAPQVYADGGMADHYNLGGYSDGGRLLRGPGDGVSDSIPATIGDKRPARLADGEFVVPARIVSELGNGSTEAGARKLYAMMDRVQAARKGSIGKNKVANNSRADKYLPA